MLHTFLHPVVVIFSQHMTIPAQPVLLQYQCYVIYPMEAISREFRVALSWELLYSDDLAVIAETEEELIKRLFEWKDNVESKGMRVNMNKIKVIISGERQMVRQKDARWPCGVCSKGVGSNSLQCTSYQKWASPSVVVYTLCLKKNKTPNSCP